MKVRLPRPHEFRRLGPSLICGGLSLAAACGDLDVKQVTVAPPDLTLAVDASVSDAASREDAALESECGNRVVEPGEACDDGNRVRGDGCNRACALESCGNGTRDGFEQCDDGNRTAGDGCDETCQTELPEGACGNGERDEGEACDDGNLEPGDGCDEACQREVCGDEVLSVGETCDPPEEGYCGDDCRLVLPDCGDGERDAPEQCDDGNAARGDGCDRCRVECGDGVIDPSLGEQCEPPGSDVGRPCDARCRWQPTCGDGIFQSEAEECDASSTAPIPFGMRCDACALLPGPSGGDGDGGMDGGGRDAGVALCEVTGRTIVPGAGFDDASAILPWQPRTRVSVQHVEDRGLHANGGLLLTFVPPAGVEPGDALWEQSGAQRCVTVRPSTRYDAKAFASVLRSGGSDHVLRLQLRAKGFANGECTGSAAYDVTGYSSAQSAEQTGWYAVETTIDTRADTRSLLLELAVAKPRPSTAEVLWDDVLVVAADVSPLCGNCMLDEAAGETCDDGNRIDRDGCGQSCQREGCGDLLVGEDEACDEGAAAWSDSEHCTPTCQRKDCEGGSPWCRGECNRCIADKCQAALAASLDLSGRAETGPRRGELRSVLAEELRECVHRTGCAGSTAIADASEYGEPTGALENCYCGSALDDACYVQGAADGRCRAEVEAAVESTSAAEIWSRISNLGGPYPVAAAVAELLWCEGILGLTTDQACKRECTFSWLCGDGILQDRSKSDADDLAKRYKRPVSDFFSEACDDGNQEGGDGCDPDCLREVCGNGLTQGGESCDDGNLQDGDGCSARCEAEYVCGDGEVTAPFEECEPSLGEGPEAVCSLTQFETDPAQCACDPATCRRVVCGDGRKGRGEACEPPGEGACDASCQFIGGSNDCLDCMSDPEGIFYQVLGDELEACFANPGCVSMLTCFTQTKCANGAGRVAECVCGRNADIEACNQEEIEATGPCVDALRAVVGDQLSNAELLIALTSQQNPSGQAYALYNPAATHAGAECNAVNQCGGDPASP